ncbi:Glyco-hydro-61 domain containing protein [Pyrenophora tritici-repentis]|nr:Glyco-hydro-61 multi-domain protein [Pyrenophora tritici-repentis]KAI0572843.1 Glyco-hydro-61 multi-domain protein [Pyrenophora tritici-repentis]KAI1530844.1 Glyco-hydro-61 domain containing protein [Pyrenophora tritici-repentis]KAI1532524.1 Glyco-hydro-61 domain containing protein [Pyrenophora tritici-repentis]KAI1540752.1 Glyco-hydro-61 domain containing protein [Pyrenophora tritici-repentis]
MFFPTTFATFTLLLPLTTAHQTLQQLWINNATPGPQIGIRTPPNNSPVKDLTSPSLICNVGGTKTPSGVKTLPAPAGAKIKVQWSPLVHMGPITHMLYGPVDDASQTSGEGAGWFKIDELDSVGGKWASQVMIGENYTHEFSLPEGLASGEYLLRSEMVALHNAQLVGGAEFYVGCAQLKVEGGKASGKSEKRGKGEACGPTISLPGAYKAEDKSVYIPDVYK